MLMFSCLQTWRCLRQQAEDDSRLACVRFFPPIHPSPAFSSVRQSNRSIDHYCLPTCLPAYNDFAIFSPAQTQLNHPTHYIYLESITNNQTAAQS